MIWLILASFTVAALACLGLVFVLAAQRVTWEIWSRLLGARTRESAVRPLSKSFK